MIGIKHDGKKHSDKELYYTKARLVLADDTTDAFQMKIVTVAVAVRLSSFNNNLHSNAHKPKIVHYITKRAVLKRLQALPIVYVLLLGCYYSVDVFQLSHVIYS